MTWLIGDTIKTFLIILATFFIIYKKGFGNNRIEKILTILLIVTAALSFVSWAFVIIISIIIH